MMWTRVRISALPVFIQLNYNLKMAEILLINIVVFGVVLIIFILVEK